MRKPLHRRGRRRAVAATELAVCLPTIVLLVLLTIECCSMIFLDQSLTIAAYEGARVSADPDSTNSAVVDRCEQILAARNINGATIALDPLDVTQAPRGGQINVTVTAPFGANSICPEWFFGGRELIARVTMVRE